MKAATPWLLVATALLATGACSAHDAAPPQPPPAAPALLAQSAAASAPSAAALPPALQGQWQPVSKALEGPGPLTLNARSLLWAPCGAAPQPMQGETASAGTVLTLGAACQLDGNAITHLRLAPRAGQPCELELSLYESPAQLARQQRLAWGVYQRQGCTP